MVVARLHPGRTRGSVNSVSCRNEDGVLFDLDLPPDLNAWLQKAAQSYDNPAQAETLLKQAYELDNQQERSLSTGS